MKISPVNQHLYSTKIPVVKYVQKNAVDIFEKTSMDDSISFQGKKHAELEKQIKTQYEFLVEKVTEELAKTGYDFVVPQLNFEYNSLVKSIAYYSMWDNSINLNMKFLNPKTMYKPNDENMSFVIFEDEHGFQLHDKFLKLGFFQNKSDCTKVNNAEYNLFVGACLKHELEHSIQLQIALSGEGNKEKLLEYLAEKFPPKKQKNVETFPFIKDFIPSKLVPLTRKIHTIEFEENFIKANPDFINSKHISKANDKYSFCYTISDLLQACMDYIVTDKRQHFFNLMEIEARKAEYGYIASGEFKEIDEKLLEAYKNDKEDDLIALLCLYIKKELENTF